nr:C1 family peptidase [Rhodoferax sp.]
MSTPHHAADGALTAVAPLFTGVQDEPKSSRLQPPLAKFGKWMLGLFIFKSSAKPPSSFNWDDKAVVPAPEDQGQLAACISYAACLAAATSYRIKTGKAISLAPRVLHLCTMELAPNLGTNSIDLEKMAVAKGLPYTKDQAKTSQAAAMSSQGACGLFDASGSLKVSAVRRFDSAEELKVELCSKGPVVVHMALFDDFWWNYVPGTVYKAPSGASSVSVQPWHIDLQRWFADHRVHDGHDGGDLLRGGWAMGLLDCRGFVPDAPRCRCTCGHAQTCRSELNVIQRTARHVAAVPQFDC